MRERASHLAHHDGRLARVNLSQQRILGGPDRQLLTLRKQCRVHELSHHSESCERCDTRSPASATHRAAQQCPNSTKLGVAQQHLTARARHTLHTRPLSQSNPD